MTPDLLGNAERVRALIDDLCALPAETSWVEFKENKADHETVGKLISALANAARLADEDFAYVLWGGDHALVGTSFEPSTQKVGNQPLELWLAQRLSPSIVFDFKPVDHHGQRLVLLSVPAAATSPVEFERTAYVRIGSATPRLSDHPEWQRALWRKLQPYLWESGVAAQFLSGDDVLSLLDYASYFDLTRQPLPDNRRGIFEKLVSDDLIQKDVGNQWNITNLGAILFAKNLSKFGSSIARKAVRFVAHDGTSRADMVIHRRDGRLGYACGIKNLLTYINRLLPRNELIGQVFREERSLYPSIAIRELVVNALIHQDMTVTGAGPLIEMFRDRLEITNPGKPLVSPARFLDFPPRSRNETLASLMRRMRLCEEQGLGIDKVIIAVELYQLPPPNFMEVGESVRVILFTPRSFADMTLEERIRACYQHAALLMRKRPSGVLYYPEDTGSRVDPPSRPHPSPYGLCAVLGMSAKVLTGFSFPALLGACIGGTSGNMQVLMGLLTQHDFLTGFSLQAPPWEAQPGGKLP